MNRREFIRRTVAGAGALGVSLATARVARPEPTLRIGYLPITDAAPLLIAHGRGYYADEGLSAPQPVRVRSWSALSESFLTGKFNVVHMLLPIPVWMRYNNDVPVKVLAWDHTNGSAITVRADAGIEGFADLGGRQIAVPYWYSMHNVILQMGLKKAGVRPVIQSQSKSLAADQANLFVLPPPEMPVALFGKKIDAYIVAEPFNAVGEVKVGARIMRFTGDMWKNHPCCVIVMAESLVRSEPVFVQKVINAIVRAQAWATDNPGAAATLLSREGQGYLPTSEDVLKRVFTGYDLATYGGKNGPKAIRHPEWKVGRIGFQPYPYPSASRFIVSRMQSTLMEGDTAFLKDLDPDRVATDLVDETFVKKAIDAVGGPGRFAPIDLTRPWDREETIDI
jgi:NitT/TauT family transport system substrate-binding protein